MQKTGEEENITSSVQNVEESVPDNDTDCENAGSRTKEDISADVDDCETTDANKKCEDIAQAGITSENEAIDETDKSDDENKDEHLKVNYAAHVQYVGWQNSVTDGATVGTTRRSLRMEALAVSCIIG